MVLPPFNEAHATVNRNIQPCKAPGSLHATHRTALHLRAEYQFACLMLCLFDRAIAHRALTLQHNLQVLMLRACLPQRWAAGSTMENHQSAALGHDRVVHSAPRFLCTPAYLMVQQLKRWVRFSPWLYFHPGGVAQTAECLEMEDRLADTLPMYSLLRSQFDAQPVR